MERSLPSWGNSCVWYDPSRHLCHWYGIGQIGSGARLIGQSRHAKGDALTIYIDPQPSGATVGEAIPLLQHYLLSWKVGRVCVAVK